MVILIEVVANDVDGSAYEMSDWIVDALRWTD